MVNQVSPTNEGHDRGDMVGKPALRQEDLAIVTQWVKNELFEKVKFLYNPEHELQVNGILYNLFVDDCKGRLVGLNTPTATGEYRRMYVELLWNEANKKKKNLVANGLTAKRSSVYSAMQNRFVGKFDGCNDNGYFTYSLPVVSVRIV